MDDALTDISLERRDGCIGIRLARGEANALTTPLIRELADAVEEAGRGARGALLGGGGSSSRTASISTGRSASRTLDPRDVPELGRLILALLEAPVPVVGAIRVMRSRGARMFLACDYRYAAAGPRTHRQAGILLGVPNPYYGDRL